jgi:ketosteroid isomerase-like protein
MACMAVVDALQRYADAFAAGDASALAACYAPVTSFSHPFTMGTPLTDPTSIEQFESVMFSVLSDATVEIANVLEVGDRAAAEVVVHTTHTGPIPLPDGSTLAPTNKRIEIRSAEFLRVDDEGRIVEHRRYYDSAALMAQLGV